MTRALISFLFAALASPALAQDYNRQDIVRGLCQPDGCDEFTILAADRLKVIGCVFRRSRPGIPISSRPLFRREAGHHSDL